MSSLIESRNTLFVELDDHDLSPQQALSNQALMREAVGDWPGALRLYRESEFVSRQNNDALALSAALGNQAAILQEQGDFDGALGILKEKETVCRRLNNPNGLANSLLRQGSILAFKQARPAEGLPLTEEALHIATTHGLSAVAKQIEPVVNTIRGLLAMRFHGGNDQIESGKPE